MNRKSIFVLLLSSGITLPVAANDLQQLEQQCEEAREKLALGMRIFIREGSQAKNLADLLPLPNDPPLSPGKALLAPPCDPIVGTGSLLAHAPHPGLAALVLLAGVNDSTADADGIARLLRGRAALGQG